MPVVGLSGVGGVRVCFIINGLNSWILQDRGIQAFHSLLIIRHGRLFETRVLWGCKNSFSLVKALSGANILDILGGRWLMLMWPTLMPFISSVHISYRLLKKIDVMDKDWIPDDKTDPDSLKDYMFFATNKWQQTGDRLIHKAITNGDVRLKLRC